MSLSSRLKEICARGRLARYESNKESIGPKKAKKLFDAMEKLLATPIKKRNMRRNGEKGKVEKAFGVESGSAFLKRLESGETSSRLKHTKRMKA